MIWIRQEKKTSQLMLAKIPKPTSWKAPKQPEAALLVEKDRKNLSKPETTNLKQLATQKIQHKTQSQTFANQTKTKNINQHLSDYLLAVKQTGCSSSTIRNYKSDIKQFLDFTGATKLSELGNKPKLLAFAHYQRDKGLKENSIKRKLVSITQFKIWLKEQNLLTSEIPLPNIKNETVQTNQEQIERQIIDQKKAEKPNKTLQPELKTQSKSKKQSSRLLVLLNLLALFLFLGGLAYFAYQQFGQALISMAYPSIPNAPNRILSYQGRLTNTAQSPISTPTDMTFRLYDADTGGTLLWSSNTCSIDPDQDGIFNTNLGAGVGDGNDGDDCGAPINDSVFTENSNVWLEVEVLSEILAPRQPIRTVAYALNSETLQGLPPAEIATHSTILMMNSSGEVVLGTDNPVIKATTSSSGLTIEANQIIIQTSSGSDGDIILAPDGSGIVDIQGDASVSGATTLIGNTYITSPNTLIFNGTTALGEISSPTDSGAYLIGANDQFTYSNSTNVQGVLFDLDDALSNIVGGTLGLWTDAGTITHLTSTSDDFAVGANSLTAPFSVDVSANAVRIGTGTTANAVLSMYASDGDTGSITYTTDDAFIFSGGNLGLAASSYLNWGSTIGTSGYGLRDNAGTLQFKHSDGDWEDIGTGGGGDSLWVDAGSYIYPLGGLPLGNPSSGGSNKISSLYLADSGPLYFGTDNDVNFSFSGSTLTTTLGSSAWNISSGLLYLDGSSNKIGIGTTNPLATLDVRSLDTDKAVASFSGATNLATLILEQNGSGDIFTASASGQTQFVITSGGNVGIGLADPTSRLQIAGATSTISNDSGDITLDAASGNISLAGNSLINANNGFFGGSVGIGTVTPARRLEIVDASNPQLRLTHTEGSIYTDFQMNSNGDLVVNVDGISNQLVLDNGGNVGIGTTTPDEKLTVNGSVNAEKYYDFTNKNYFLDPAAVSTALNIAGSAIIGANATAAGNVTMGGQLQVGRFAETPTAVGEGAIIFNTTTDTHQCYNGSVWYNCGGTLYSNTNSIADGNYITVTHSLNTSNLLSSAWIDAQGNWKLLDAAYKPAIAWEGKDTQKGLYHNSLNSYVPTQETNTSTDTLHTGMVFDTLEDGTKMDSSNTTSSYNFDLGDDGSSNYINLNQRIQAGRAGLMGGQTMSTSTTDNDGQTYLGSNTVNDTFYYDRSQDSTPEVLVELGIDPNWYNGVTLSVATGSATYSQAGTLADKNPNLTTKYNGSLIKATGTDSTPRTIYITIKSPTTFDWTNYNGKSAAGVTITPGLTQTLGSTGVSVTFTGGVNYNVGDVFKIASWYIEPESAIRGAKQQFPERSYVVASGTGGAGYVDIIDADTQKMWMRFDSTTNGYLQGATTGRNPQSVEMLNGNLYIGQTGASSGSLVKPNFATDSNIVVEASSQAIHSHSISGRNSSTGSYTTINSTVALVSNQVNDVAAAVIPNQPTQEITVSGWGYIQGAAATTVTETVKLPYTFNDVPRITTTLASSKTTTAPSSLSECVNANQRLTGIASNIQNSSFTQRISASDAADGNLGSTTFYCYTWTATGTVSPKQFVAVATGATSADGGTTIINETNGSKADVFLGSQIAAAYRTSKVALTERGDLYLASDNATAPRTTLDVYYGIHGIPGSETSIAQYRNGFYMLSNETGGWSTNGMSIAGAIAANEIKSLSVSPLASTNDPNSNVIYIGTTAGVTALHEKQGRANIGDGSVESGGSVKYYTKDYISEEMIGDVRGMWSLNNSNAASDFEDVSSKANVLTGTNITAGGDSVSGVRGTATDFDGSSEYMSCTDAACGGTSKLDMGTSNYTLSAWIKTSNSAAIQSIIRKGNAGGAGTYLLNVQTNGKVRFYNVDGASTASQVDSNISVNDGKWHHVVGVANRNSGVSLYIDGVLDNANSTAFTSSMDNTDVFYIGYYPSGTQYFNGQIDEVMVTATELTAAQIKNMYQVGYRALQSHSTSLASGAADTNQQLQYASTGTNTVGVVTPDLNNQYLYVGLNSTTLGGLTKIQLNSDAAVKKYIASGNTPSGGASILDEDVTSLAVGETLYAVGSAASGIKTMGLDDNATSTSGNFVSKTYTLPKNIGSAVLWMSPLLDGSDGSNSITVQASVDNGSNYTTCTLVGTDTANYTLPEREYSCTFPAAGNQLKVRFQFARGSTKTNTYITQYGITWLGETGFRVEQADDNNVRLYNFSGETQNLKLNVTGASTASMASPWTDAGSYLYATGYESLRIYDGGGTNYLGLSHDGTLANFSYNGTTVLSINSNGDLLPNVNDTQNLGSDAKRWKDLFLGGDTLHIGTSLTDEGIISYDTTSNIFSFGTDSTSNGDIAFFDNQLYLDKSTGNVGIGTTTPDQKLTINGSINLTSGNLQLGGTSVITSGRLMLAADGSAAAPAFSFSSDPDNGMFRPTINQLALSTSGSERLRIDANGNVGIGTTTPNVALHVIADSSSNQGMYLDRYSNDSGQTRSYVRKARGTLSSPSAVQSNDFLGGFSFAGYDGSSFADAGIIQMQATESWTGSARGSLMHFATVPTGSSIPLTRMTIGGDGNVGIGGIALSTSRLHVYSNLVNTIGGGVSTVTLEDTTALSIDGGAGIALRGVYNSGGASAGFGGIKAGKSNATSGNLDSYLAFYSRSNSGGILEAMRIDANQRTGFGTTNPGTHRISVVGTAGLSTGTAWTNTSDYRLKNVEENLSGSSIEKILALNPISFRWNDLHHEKFGSSSDKLNYGFIAQEVEGVLPHMISTDEEGYKWYNPSGFEALLTAGIQEQQGQISALAALVNQQGAVFNNVGELILTGSSPTSYAVATPTGISNRVAAFADVFVARLTAGFIKTKELAAETVNISERLIAKRITTNLIDTNNQELVINADNKITGDLLVAEDLRVDGRTKLGQLTATDATITGQLNATAIQAEELDVNSARINSIESKLAELENATVSGTLYANNIEANSISANVISGLQERLTSQIESTLSQPTLLASLFGNQNQQTDEYLTQLAQELNVNLATAAASLDPLGTLNQDLTMIADSAFIQNYFEVNGSAYMAGSLKLGQNLMIGDQTIFGANFISYQPELAEENDFTFSIQPAGLGKLSLLAGLMQLDSQGFVSINGDLRVAGALEVTEELRAQGTLLTNLIGADRPGEDIQVQLVTLDENGEDLRHSSFAFVNESLQPVASFSASGDLSLTGSLRLGQVNTATNSGELVNAQRSAGQAILPAGSTEITITSAKLEENSMIYVTPLNSTNNQVLYVKNKIADSPFTPENDAIFTVGIDYPLGQDVTFNWWIIQLN